MEGTEHEGHIIDFKNRVSSEYGAQLDEAMEFLEQLTVDVRNQAFLLALAKAWREWDLNQPEGTEFELLPEMLERCNDPRVRELARLEGAIWSTMEQIRRGGEPG